MNPLIEAQLEHFRAIPWCAKQLDRPDQVLAPLTCRSGQYENKHNLVTTTLNTPDTLPAVLLFYDRARSNEMVTEVRALVTLGGAVMGYGGIAHGGALMTLLDEVAFEVGAVNIHSGVMPYSMIVTAYLNTKFQRPVPAPGTVLFKASMKKVEGGKFFIGVVIEDHSGAVLTSADVLYIGVEGPAKL